MLESFRLLRKSSDISNISDSDISPAKARSTPSSDKYYFSFFAAFASLREISRFFWLRRSRAVPLRLTLLFTENPE
jgi:hypothetical protein